MKSDKVPEIDHTALREHGNVEQVERVWRRLDNELGSGIPRPRTALWWAPAAVVIVFGSGVFVGARWSRHEAQPPAQVTAEPAGVAEPALPPESPAPAVIEQERERKKPRQVTAPMLAPPDELAPAPVVDEPMSVAPPAPAPLSVTGPPDWQRLAENAEFQAARAALDRLGGYDTALANASAEQLVALADIARATGPRPVALRALSLFLQRYPAHPQAPEVALSLGNMLESAGDRAGAAEAFAVYRRLSPKGDFAEDALARQVDVAIESGDAELARKLFDQYAKEFPNGRRLGELRKQLAKLTGQTPAGAGTAVEKPGNEPEDEPSEETEDPPAPSAAPRK
jgi:hypothetical protein